APAGDAEATELLGRTRVENDELLAALEPRGQILRLHLGDVVHNLHLLAEVLARNVHAPLGRQPLGDPAVDAAVEHRDLAVAQTPQRARGGRGPAAGGLAPGEGWSPEGAPPAAPRIRAAGAR